MTRSTHNPRRAALTCCALVCLLLAVQGRVGTASDNATSGGATSGGAASDGTTFGVNPTTAPASAATSEGRLAIFDDVWLTVRERYYDPTLHGLDWSALRAEFRPRATAAGNQAELYTLLRRMLARLRDPHTRVYAPDESFDWRELRYISVGVRVREIEGEMSVTEVERGSEAQRAGVRAGDVVVSIDGEPALEILARRLREQLGAAVDERLPRAYAVARIFDGARDSFAAVVFRTDAGRERSVRLRRASQVRAPSLRVWRAGGYGVAQFNAFSAVIAGQFARSLKQNLRGARGLVLDLRENGGGDAEAMTDIASAFLPVGTTLGRFTDRRGRVQLEPQTRSAMLSAADTVESFRGPVIILTSARTASASEVFIAALKERGRASTVGENTCGCVLGIRRPHTLPDGGTLEISEVDFRTIGGTRLEGIGLTPDEQLPPTRQDLRAGRDRALKRALEILEATAKKN